MSNEQWEKYLFISILFIIMLANSCVNRDDIILRKIAFSVKDGDRINLSDFTNFEWNNVVICNPGTTLKDYEKMLGPVKLKDFDLTNVIIFREDDKVVKIIKRDYHPEKYHNVEFFIDVNKYIIYNKNAAVFKVTKIENRVELRPVLE